MAGTPLQRPLYACTVTVTTSPQSLLALIQAIASPAGFYKACPGSANNFQLQPDPNNGTNILIGDENVLVSPQNCGANLQPGAGESAGIGMPYIAPIGSVWVVAAGAGAALLNVSVFQ